MSIRQLKRHGLLTSNIQENEKLEQYEGERHFETNDKHGRGTYQYSNSFFSYSGEWVDNKKHGRGLLTMKDGSTVEADFVNGEIDGRGVKRWPDGSTYTGEFHEGELHGGGNLIAASGEQYTGGFEFNRRHGMGKLQMKNGDVYEGEFKEHRYNGLGKLHYEDGRFRYEGNFVDGLFEGVGIWQDMETGEYYDGEFRKGQKEGYGAQSIVSHIEVEQPVTSDNDGEETDNIPSADNGQQFKQEVNEHKIVYEGDWKGGARGELFIQLSVYETDSAIPFTVLDKRKGMTKAKRSMESDDDENKRMDDLKQRWIMQENELRLNEEGCNHNLTDMQLLKLGQKIGSLSCIVQCLHHPTKEDLDIENEIQEIVGPKEGTLIRPNSAGKKKTKSASRKEIEDPAPPREKTRKSRVEKGRLISLVSYKLSDASVKELTKANTHTIREIPAGSTTCDLVGQSNLHHKTTPVSTIIAYIDEEKDHEAIFEDVAPALIEPGTYCLQFQDYLATAGIPLPNSFPQISSQFFYFVQFKK